MAIQARARVHNTIGAPPPARPHEQTRRRADHLQLHLHERIDARAAIIGHWISHRAWGEAARAAWRYREYGAISIAIWLALTPWLIYTGFPTGDTIRCALFAAIVGWPFAWLTGDGQQARLVAREQRRLADKIKPTPHVERVDELHHGDIHHATVIAGQIPDGIQPSDLEHQETMLASCYRTPTEVTAAQTGHFNIRLVHHDLLNKTPAWTLSDAPGPTLRLGVDRDGRDITGALLEARYLIAGMSGAGKSILLNAYIAQLAHLGVELALIDPHRTDFKPWYPHATWVARDVGSAIDRLAELVDVHRAGLDENDANDADMVNEVRLALVIDELATLTHSKLKYANEVRKHLIELATGGRKTGIVILAATQYPEVDVLPSLIRGQFTHRIGLRCEFDQATDVVFGTGARPVGVRLAKVPANQPGRGWLFNGGNFTQMRGFTLYGQRKRTVAKSIPPRQQPVSGQVGEATPQPDRIEGAIPLPATDTLEIAGKRPTESVPTTANLRELCLEAADLAGPIGVNATGFAEKLDVPYQRIYRQMVALRKLGLVRTDGTRWYREAS